MYYIEIDNENNCTGNYSIDVPQDSFIQSLELEEIDNEVLGNLQAYSYIDGSFVLNQDLIDKYEAVEKIEELQKYLNETDWMAVRFAEEGTEIDPEVRQKRREARAEISRLRELLD